MATDALSLPPHGLSCPVPLLLWLSCCSFPSHFPLFLLAIHKRGLLLFFEFREHGPPPCAQQASVTAHAFCDCKKRNYSSNSSLFSMLKKNYKVFLSLTPEKTLFRHVQEVEDITGLLAQLQQSTHEVSKWEVLILNHWVVLDESSWAKVKSQETLELRPQAAGK